jgi:Cu/Ag efflux protein CusF
MNNDFRTNTIANAVLAGTLTNLDSSKNSGIDEVVTKTANYTLTAIDTVVLFDATAAARTATLPAAAGVKDKTFIIKKIDSSANTVTIDANGTETIQALGAPALTQVLTAQGDTLTVQSTGTGWVAY